MDQLTQMELLQVQELAGIEALAVRKCLFFAEQCQDPELKQWLRDAAAMHQAHVEALVDQMRRHSGRETGQDVPRPDA